MTGRTPVMLMARELGLGGTERQLTEMAKLLNQESFAVHVGYFRDGIRRPELEQAGVQLLPLPVTSFMRPGALRGAWLMARYVRQHNIRLVHTFDYPLNCFGVPVARLARSPVVLSSQRALRELTPAPFNWILRATDHLVDGIVVNSRAVALDLTRRLRVPERLIHLCYNGIDTAVFRPEPRQHPASLPPAQLTLGVVCVLRPEKGLDTLLSAFAQLAPADPAVRLLIVGSGSEREALGRLAVKLNIADRCTFEPAVKNPAPWLRSIDVFVLPSLSEALSNSLMEAMACGCACIASDAGGNPELVDHDRTGLLFRRGDAHHLAEQMKRLITDGELRRRLADAGLAQIEARFSLRASGSRMSEIYHHCLTRSK